MTLNGGTEHARNKVPEAQSRLSGLRVCLDLSGEGYLGKIPEDRSICWLQKSNGAWCVPRWTGKTDITIATVEPPFFSMLGTTSLNILYKSGVSRRSSAASVITMLRGLVLNSTLTKYTFFCNYGNRRWCAIFYMFNCLFFSGVFV